MRTRRLIAAITSDVTCFTKLSPKLALGVRWQSAASHRVARAFAVEIEANGYNIRFALNQIKDLAALCCVRVANLKQGSLCSYRISKPNVLHGTRDQHPLAVNGPP